MKFGNDLLIIFIKINYFKSKVNIDIILKCIQDLFGKKYNNK